MFYIQPRLWVFMSAAFWLVSFEKRDRNVHKGHVLIIIFRQIFTTLKNDQEKEASAVNRLRTRNSDLDGGVRRPQRVCAVKHTGLPRLHFYTVGVWSPVGIHCMEVPSTNYGEKSLLLLQVCLTFETVPVQVRNVTASQSRQSEIVTSLTS